MVGSHRDDPIVIEDDEDDELGDIHAFVETLSYEEFWAYEELLNKTIISEFLNQRKYLSTKMNDGNDSCCICLDTYGDGEELGKLDCGHKFHYQCIKKWLNINITCPICKRSPSTL